MCCRLLCLHHYSLTSCSVVHMYIINGSGGSTQVPSAQLHVVSSTIYLSTEQHITTCWSFLLTYFIEEASGCCTLLKLEHVIAIQEMVYSCLSCSSLCLWIRLHCTYGQQKHALQLTDWYVMHWYQCAARERFKSLTYYGTQKNNDWFCGA